jgi:hypothetical protein
MQLADNRHEYPANTLFAPMVSERNEQPVAQHASDSAFPPCHSQQFSLTSLVSRYTEKGNQFESKRINYIQDGPHRSSGQPAIEDHDLRHQERVQSG